MQRFKVWKRDDVEQLVEYEAETVYEQYKFAADIAAARGWDEYDFAAF